MVPPETQTVAASSAADAARPRMLISDWTRNTPTRLRLLGIVSVLAIVAGGVVAFIAASTIGSATERIDESSGPVLVATQQVSASLAEADAAATGVHLSGADEDRAQRGLYEQAIGRAAAGVEEIARLIGDDEPSHEALVRINRSLTEYAGVVEASRLANQAGLANADERLVESINLIRTDISPEVAQITTRAQRTLDDDIAAGETQVIIAYLLLGLAAVALVLGQVYMAGRTRRLLNPLTAISTIAVIAMIVSLYSLYTNQQRHLEIAQRDGYESIALTAEIQASAFRFKANEGRALIQGLDAFPAEARDQAIAELVRLPVDGSQVELAFNGARLDNQGLLIDAVHAADNRREDAAAAEMLARWRRYRGSSDQINGLLAFGNTSEARALASGQGNTDFNGFNTAVESVLSDNRAQFEKGVADARNTLDWLQPILFGLSVLAALLAWAGFDRRVRDYR